MTSLHFFNVCYELQSYLSQLNVSHFLWTQKQYVCKFDINMYLSICILCLPKFDNKLIFLFCTGSMWTVVVLCCQSVNYHHILQSFQMGLCSGEVNLSLLFLEARSAIHFFNKVCPIHISICTVNCTLCIELFTCLKDYHPQ